MCIMEVRPGQHSITIVQACAHNANTIKGDLEMFKPLAEARGEHDVLQAIKLMEFHITRAYAVGLEMFGEKLAADHQNGNGHWDLPKAHTHGNERSFTQVVNDATKLAHPYETR